MSKMQLLTPTLLLALALAATAHPHHSVSKRELAHMRRADEALQARAAHCSHKSRAYKEARKLHSRRGLGNASIRSVMDEHFGDLLQKRVEPHMNPITQNDTCVLSPEMTEGPYYVVGELIRQNITEGQAGAALHLNMGFLDIETCQPVPNVYVEFWHANSTGYYSGYTASNPGGGGGESSPGTSASDSSSALSASGSSSQTIFSATGSQSASASAASGMPSGTPPSGSGNTTSSSGAPGGSGSSGGPGSSSGPTDNTSFLRGIWPTNEDGVVEIYTLFPGHYSGRAVHVHYKVHANVTLNANATIQSNTLLHTGQLFISEDETQAYLQNAAYASNTGTRTTNDEDNILEATANSGASSMLDIEAFDGSDIANGAWGWITIGVNASAVASGAVAGNSVDTTNITTSRDSTQEQAALSALSADSDSVATSIAGAIAAAPTSSSEEASSGQADSARRSLHLGMWRALGFGRR
ncbi:aromatic compound dioxygenase [Ceraceosorus guamensis]|uniref:Aromatic compound dioxygenase n=1 Tax=Ceraceosorus guamensis TaxID=1522189 RepID=A0A316VZG0_9BASI|nr:aromatic compound dioxygenase [Ceraceosorus guamensis]PWN42920.1 aromatic compound dioxygenase [Ceraceosorus guamensis]